VSVAIPRCAICPTEFCGAQAADRRYFPFRILRCAQHRGQRARHTDAVGLRDSWGALKVSSITMGLADGSMPATGSPTTRDIGQAEQFAINVVLGCQT
jgi:hypothetical protein